jgi:hypothetical protein
MIGSIDNTALTDRLIKAGPAAAALKLCVAPEQRIPTHGTVKSADLMRMLKRTASRPFRPFLPGNAIDVFWQDFLPLVIAQVDRIQITPGINRVVLLIGCIHILVFWKISIILP